MTTSQKPFDLAAARKIVLVDMVRELRDRRGLDMGAASTLLRLNPPKLVGMVAELCGVDYSVETGRVEALVPEPPQPVVKVPDPEDTNEVEPLTEKPAKRRVVSLPPRAESGALPLQAVIHLVPGKTFRAGSRRAERLALLREGMTVAQAAEVGMPRHRLTTLIEQGFITVSL